MAIFTLYLTNILDVVFTYYLIEYKGAVELNPFINWLIQTFEGEIGYVAALIYKLFFISLLLLYIYKDNNRRDGIVSALAIVFVCLNVYQIVLINIV